MDVHDGLADGGRQGGSEPPGEQTAGRSAAGGGATGAGSSTAGSSTAGSSGSGPGQDRASMLVEVDGETRQLPAERDYTGDGRPDAAAETADGRVIVFADTEDDETGGTGPDGRADEAYVVDKQTGRVVGAAHLDPATGRWVEEDRAAAPTGPAAVVDPETGRAAPVPHVDPETGQVMVSVPPAEPETGEQEAESSSAAPADPGGPTGTAPADPGEPGGTAGGGSGTMTVDLGGQTRELPAERDYTGDGRPDAAAETADGLVVVFADTEDNETGAAGPDGRADEAYVVDKQTGRVVGVAHVDPRSGEWVEGMDTDGPMPPAGGDGEVAN